jgi:hypothetical protein
MKSKVMTALIRILILFSMPLFSQNRTEWMRQARWGVMTHYLADWIASREDMDITPEKWNRLVENFNTDGLARQLDSVGAGYYMISLGQNSGYYISPNNTYNKIVGDYPSKCSKRDLVNDLYSSLKTYNIRLFVYLPSGAPAKDDHAKTHLQWQNGPHRNKNFQILWQKVIREWSERWGDKVSGWWFDGCYWPNIMYRTAEEPNFKSFSESARSGNPNSIVAFNPGVVYRTISITPYEDFIAGECPDPGQISLKRDYEGIIDGAQLHILSFLGERWGNGTPRFENEQASSYTNEILKQKGVFTWDVPVKLNGLIPIEYMTQLKAIAATIN